MSREKVQSIFGARSTRIISRQADSTLRPSTSQPRSAPSRPIQKHHSQRGSVQNGHQIRQQNGVRPQSRPQPQSQAQKRDFRGMFDSDSDGEGRKRHAPPAQPLQRTGSHPNASNRKPLSQHPRSSSALHTQQSHCDSRANKEFLQSSRQALNARQGSGKILRQVGQQGVGICPSARQHSNHVRTVPNSQRPAQVLHANELQPGGSTGQRGQQNSSMPLRQQVRPGGHVRNQKPPQQTRIAQLPRQIAGKQLAGVHRDVGPASKGAQEPKRRIDQNGSNRGLAVHPARRAAVAGPSSSGQHGLGRSIQSGRAAGAPHPASQRNGQHGAVQPHMQQPRMKASQGFFSQAKLRTKAQVRVLAGRKPGLLRRRSTEEEDDLDGFIADGDDLSEDACDWRKELKKITGYDGSQYKDVDDADDPSMEVGWQRCLAEEQRSAKRGREEDAREEILNLKRKQKK